MLQKEHLEAVRKAGKGQKVAPPKVRHRVCKLFGVSMKPTKQLFHPILMTTNIHMKQENGAISSEKRLASQARRNLLSKFATACNIVGAHDKESQHNKCWTFYPNKDVSE